MRDDKLSRRGALCVLGAIPLLSVACGKKSEPDSCNDVSALGEAEKSARSALQYVDKSPFGDKRCEICSLYQPASDPASCGGCQVVK